MFQNVNLLLQYITRLARATIGQSNYASLSATRVAQEAAWLVTWTASIPAMCRCSIDICETAG